MNNGEFHKMHGLGNDFIIIDCREQKIAMSPSKIRAIADRRTGIGCDQLIILEPSDIADIAMRIYNSDGGEVGACGNASRCVIALLNNDARIETAGGIIGGTLTGNDIVMNMGVPRFEWQEIPLAYPMDTASLPLAWDGLATGNLAEGALASPMAVNVGNPHVIFFVDDAVQIDLAEIGPVIEQDDVFPEHVNVNIASLHDGAIKLHVWERGVGITRACGTGACATAVAAMKKGYVTSPVRVDLPGGSLTIAWDGSGPVIMTGGATHVFKGHANWDDFG